MLAEASCATYLAAVLADTSSHQVLILELNLQLVPRILPSALHQQPAAAEAAGDVPAQVADLWHRKV